MCELSHWSAADLVSFVYHVTYDVLTGFVTDVDIAVRPMRDGDVGGESGIEDGGKGMEHCVHELRCRLAYVIYVPSV